MRLEWQSAQSTDALPKKVLNPHLNGMILAISRLLDLHEFQKPVAILQRNRLVPLKIHHEPMFLPCRSTETLQSCGEFLPKSSDYLAALLRCLDWTHSESCLSMIERRSGARPRIIQYLNSPKVKATLRFVSKNNDARCDVLTTSTTAREAVSRYPRSQLLLTAPMPVLVHSRPSETPADRRRLPARDGTPFPTLGIAGRPFRPTSL